MIIVNNIDTADLEKVAIKEGKLQVFPYSFWRNFNLETLLNFMHKNAFYIIPTTELIDFLRNNIIQPAIEIGAGNGFLGRSLNIPITDSKMQEDPTIKEIYKLHRTPTIHYPDDIEQLDAIEAVIKYKPATVLGSYITYKYNESVGEGNPVGVDDQYIIKNCKRYIMIGNKTIAAHYKNPLMNDPHIELYFKWLITRAADQQSGRIFIWNSI